jgi:MinD-like ATPase involved in chromosome partitioning or flagellar assembly
MSGREGRNTILETIGQNAVRAGLRDPVITVARDPRGGYRVRVVHVGLAGLVEADRQELLLAGLEESITSSELLTPSEEEWYGKAFSEDESQATWSDALWATSPSSQLVFASDLDQDLKPPAIVTFYSLRGGVGRTTALASTASILASRGRRVLCIDMDLEAPGLSFLLGGREPGNDQGVVPMLLAFERGDDVDIRDHVQRVTEVDELYCLPAGRLSADYAERLRLIDPENWYLETPNPLYRLIESAEASALHPDIILIDARTGISPASAPLLFDISDLSVICFFPHPQARRGTELLVKALLNSTSRRSADTLAVTPEPRFIVAPVPPGPSARRMQNRATEWIDDWLSGEQSRRSMETGPLLAEELTHFINYSAEVAFQDNVLSTSGSGDAYRPVADWLEQLLPQASQAPVASSAEKSTVLSELDFSTGTAEQQDSFLADYVETRVSTQAALDQYPLVIGRKGTGKTALFRWLLERQPGQAEPIPIFCPPGFRDRYPWVVSADGFSSVETSVLDVNWRVFWSCYIALTLWLTLPESERQPPPEAFEVDLSQLANGYGELEIVNTLRQMLSNADAGILATRWLERGSTSCRRGNVSCCSTA